MKKLLFALFVCGAVFVAAPALAADGTITGTITHAADNHHISGIYIYFQNTNTSAYAYTWTGDDGTYSVNVAPGTYDVNPSTYTSDESGIYYIGQSKTATVTSGGTTTKNFALQRRGRFSGTVYASNGTTKLKDATVYFTKVGGYALGSGSGTSASSGKYFITPTPSDSTASAAGTYGVTISKVGYFSASISDVVLTGDERTVTKNFRLTPRSTVSGKIKNTSGGGIAGATVTLTKSTGSTYATTTNASGAYTVSIYDTYPYNGTAVGDYTLTVSASGRITKTADIAITADATRLTGRNFILNVAGRITGTIKKSNGLGLAGATVVADDGYGHTYSTTTGTNGKYVLSKLKPSSSYTITATKTYYVGQKLYNVSVGGGHTASGKNLKLPKAVTFSGTVKSASGSPVEGAVIYLFKRNKTRMEIADYAFTVKSNGGFNFRNVSPGDYRLKIILNGYITYNQEMLTLNANTTGKKYRLYPGGVIYGHLTSGGKNVNGAVIEVYAINNGADVAYTTATTDEKGLYLVRGLKTGDYRLKISSTKYVTQIVTAHVKAGKITGSVVALAPAGSVSGYLTDSVTGLPISALAKVVDTSVFAWANSNGYYVLDGIAPGARRITVVSPYYNLPSQKDVTVTINNMTKNVNFSLTPRQ